MKYLPALLLLFASFMASAQDTTRPVVYATTQKWICSPTAECGTWQNPAILRHTPVNCPDSMVDSNSFYSLVYMFNPAQGKKMWCKIPADRNEYFINKGSLPDSFTVLLNGNLLQLKQSSLGFVAEVLMDGPGRSFHLDIQVANFNAIVDRNAFGNVSVIGRTPKTQK